MNRVFKAMLAALAAVCAMSPARAELTVEITQGVSDPIPLAIVPFSGTEPFDVAGLVERDLKRSGLFAPMDRKDMVDRPTRSEDVKIETWKMLRTYYVVVGQMQPDGEGRYAITFEIVNVLNGQRLLKYRQPATTSTLRAASHKVADVIFEKLTGVRGAFSTRIAYISVRGKIPQREYQLIVADADGENPRVIAKSPQPLMSPAWSPDGQSLAYVSFEKNTAAIFTQMLRTGERRRVSARAGVNGAPAWSPDGRQIALTLSRKDGNLDVYVLKLDDQTLIRITEDEGIDTEPVWSVDGKSLYFTSDRSGSPQIYRAGVGANERAQRVTFEGSYNARARLSPDGKFMAVTTLDKGGYRIGVVDLKNGNLRVLTTGKLDESPSFAPNGAVLIYGTQDKGRGLLATVSADGRVKQVLAADGVDIREPVWSPFPAP